jgi:hypothetical protein
MSIYFCPNGYTVYQTDTRQFAFCDLFTPEPIESQTADEAAWSFANSIAQEQDLVTLIDADEEVIDEQARVLYITELIKGLYIAFIGGESFGPPGTMAGIIIRFEVSNKAKKTRNK